MLNARNFYSFITFFSYFFSYIFHSKNRQRPLLIAIFGLSLSAFALIFVHSIMEGLQQNLIWRSKRVLGDYVVYLRGAGEKNPGPLEKYLQEQQIDYTREYEIELLIRQGNYLAPLLLRGIDQRHFLPSFLPSQWEGKGLILSYDLAHRLKIVQGDSVNLISPGHQIYSLADVPRQGSVIVEQLISTDVPEVDLLHGQIRLSYLQNLLQKKTFNRIRIYCSLNLQALTAVVQKNYGTDVTIRSWEQENAQLVWSLNLETSVMLFLFGAMTLLVALAITSGLLILLDKMKGDLVAFWILGSAKKKMYRQLLVFFNLVNISAIAFGLLLGISSLYLLDLISGQFMPQLFIEKSIPFKITNIGLYLAFFTPYLVSLLVLAVVISDFYREQRPLDAIRTT